jgi:hypothetical protein
VTAEEKLKTLVPVSTVTLEVIDDLLVKQGVLDVTVAGGQYLTSAPLLQIAFPWLA